MKKLHRGRYLALAPIAAAAALVVGAPPGAYAAGNESARGSAPAEAIVEAPGSSTQPAAPVAPSPSAPAAPASTELTPGAGTETSGGEVSPLRHGSSVGSGDVPGEAQSPSSGPSNTPDSSGYYEPDSSGYYESEPSTSSMSEEPVGTPPAGSEVHAATPTATAASSSRDLDAAVGAATPLSLSKAPQGGGIASAPPAAAVFRGPGDQAASGSLALPLLVMLVLGLILGFACVRLWRRRQRRQLEALWRQQAAVWEAAIRRVGPGATQGVSKPSAKPLQGIKVG